MEKKMLIVVLSTLLVIFSANMEGVESQGVSCYDSCSTGCVNPDLRLMKRCDRKCQIRCSPGIFPD
ncbi:WAT1-related At1g25270-like, partial [Olea europaea subsp. europaea]